MTENRYGAGFWIIVLAFLTTMAYCTVPTPLYTIYQDRDALPSFVVTIIFATYAFGVMLSLYFAGHISDWFGRRRVVRISLIVSLISAVVFIIWSDIVGLLVARLLSGIGVGLLTATATAYIFELGAASRRSPLNSSTVATFANLGGLSFGPLVAGAIATYSTRPLVLPYVIFAVLFVVLSVIVWMVPETVEPPAERPAYHPQRIAVPSAARGTYIAAAAAAFGAFAVFGTFTGLVSTFLNGILNQHSYLLSGLAPFLVFMAAALAQILTAKLAARFQLILALTVAVLGLITLAISAPSASLTLFLIGGTLSGAGVGILFRASTATVGQISDPARRGEALAGIFLLAYAGMMIPPLFTTAALMIWSDVSVLVVLTLLIVVLIVASGSRLLRHH